MDKWVKSQEDLINLFNEYNRENRPHDMVTVLADNVIEKARTIAEANTDYVSFKPTRKNAEKIFDNIKKSSRKLRTSLEDANKNYFLNLKPIANMPNPPNRFEEWDLFIELLGKLDGVVDFNIKNLDFYNDEDRRGKNKPGNPNQRFRECVGACFVFLTGNMPDYKAEVGFPHFIEEVKSCTKTSGCGTLQDFITDFRHMKRYTVFIPWTIDCKWKPDENQD